MENVNISDCLFGGKIMNKFKNSKVPEVYSVSKPTPGKPQTRSIGHRSYSPKPSFGHSNQGGVKPPSK